MSPVRSFTWLAARRTDGPPWLNIVDLRARPRTSCGRRTQLAPAAGDDDDLVVEQAHIGPARLAPPSRTTVWPVIQDESSESKNETAPAMSAGTPSRLSG